MVTSSSCSCTCPNYEQPGRQKNGMAGPMVVASTSLSSVAMACCTIAARYACISAQPHRLGPAHALAALFDLEPGADPAVLSTLVLLRRDLRGKLKWW